MPCPRCKEQWLDIGPEGGKCPRHGFISRGEIDDASYDPPPGRKRENTLAPRRAVIKRLADVEREQVSWLWRGRIARGKIAILEGDPEVGKSYVSLALATAVTLGTGLPGEDRQDPGSVLFLTAEDGLGDTIRPRAEDMGADLQRIYCLTATTDDNGTEKHFSLADDLHALEDILVFGAISLVVIDPINAYLGSIDTNRDSALRNVLTPLAALAEKYKVAVVVIRHLTKGSRERAIYRGQGSIAYVAAARTALLVAKNPNDESERVIVCIKNNLAEHPTAMAFEITNGAFRWKGESKLTAEDLLATPSGSGGASAVDEAQEFLREALVDGSRSVKEVEKEANSLGISRATLRRASKSLGIVASRIGEAGKQGGGAWLWRLPTSSEPAGLGDQGLDAQDDHLKNLIALTRNESGAGAATTEVDHLNLDEPSVCRDCSGPTPSGDLRCAACASKNSLVQMALANGAIFQSSRLTPPTQA